MVSEPEPPCVGERDFTNFMEEHLRAFDEKVSEMGLIGITYLIGRSPEPQEDTGKFTRSHSQLLMLGKNSDIQWFMGNNDLRALAGVLIMFRNMVQALGGNTTPECQAFAKHVLLSWSLAYDSIKQASMTKVVMKQLLGTDAEAVGIHGQVLEELFNDIQTSSKEEGPQDGEEPPPPPATAPPAPEIN